MASSIPHRTPVLVIAVLFVAAFWVSYTSAGDTPGSNGDVHGRTAAFVAVLEAKG